MHLSSLVIHPLAVRPVERPQENGPKKIHASEKGVNTTLLGVNNDLPWCQEDVSHFLASLPAPGAVETPGVGHRMTGYHYSTFTSELLTLSHNEAACSAN